MDGNVKELDKEIRNLTEENSRIQNALKELNSQRETVEISNSELINLNSKNDSILAEVANYKTNIIEISKRVRKSAAQLSELNNQREILIHENSGSRMSCDQKHKIDQPGTYNSSTQDFGNNFAQKSWFNELIGP